MQNKRKKGSLWVSAVLYIALGVVAITLVLSAGIPLINKMKDRNTILQAKETLNIIDKAISDVRKEGIGSKRFLSPVIVKGGEIVIDPRENFETIRWRLKTNAVLVEPCAVVMEEGTISGSTGTMLDNCLSQELVLKEGNSYYYETTTIVKDEYYARVELDYRNFADITTNNANPLKGTYNFKIENEGIPTGGGKPAIKVTVT